MRIIYGDLSTRYSCAIVQGIYAAPACSAIYEREKWHVKSLITRQRASLSLHIPLSLFRFPPCFTWSFGISENFHFPEIPAAIFDNEISLHTQKWHVREIRIARPIFPQNAKIVLARRHVATDNREKPITLWFWKPRLRVTSREERVAVRLKSTKLVKTKEIKLER